MRSCRKRTHKAAPSSRSPKKQRLNSTAMASLGANKRSSFSDGKRVSVVEEISPEALALKLAEISNDLKKKIGSVDLVGLDIKKSLDEIAEEFFNRREEVKKLMGNPKSFDEDSHMDLNYLVAAVGGAKLLVDQVRTTRSTTQRLVSCCGLKEEEFLYNGLNRSHRESKAIEDLSNNRQSSMVESFVDFQKQIQFKMVVLDHLAEKFADCISDSYPRAKKKQVKKTLFKTPLRKGHISPLNSDRIVESYAFEVASKIADRSRKRKVAGIPFNIHLLDDDNE